MKIFIKTQQMVEKTYLVEADENFDINNEAEVWELFETSEQIEDLDYFETNEDIVEVRKLYPMKKIVSYCGVNENRPIRENEVDGWDYFFVTPEEMIEKRDNGELLQFIEFKGTYYGYPYSEFEDIDELIIVSGGSGTGKDTIFKEIFKYDKYFEKKVGFLFSIPETISLFVNYAKEKCIDYRVINLIVEEKERLRRVIYGDLINSNNDLIEKQLEVKVLDNDEVIVFEGEREIQNYPNIKEIIEKAKERVFRDRKNPFEDGIRKVEESGIDVLKINLTEKTLNEAVSTVKYFISVDKKYFHENIYKEVI